MFQPLGLFKGLPCPEETHCALINCIFAHPCRVAAPSVSPAAENKTPSHKTTSVSSEDRPTLKRKRRESDSWDESHAVVTKDKQDAPPERSKARKLHDGQKALHQELQQLKSVAKRVSPPPTNNERLTLKHNDISNKVEDKGEGTKGVATSQMRRQSKKETLNPRLLSKPPASHQVRMSILVKLHEEMTRLNDLMQKAGDPSKKALILSKDELVSMALDEEERIAKENPSVYSNVIKLRIAKLRKMPLSEWEEDVINYLRPKDMSVPSQTPTVSEPNISTGLTAKEEIAVLSRLIASPESLKKLGVVTTMPTAEEIRVAKSGADAAQGWEKCDRCSGRFQVYPGRREDGVLASGGTCTYHYAKPIRPVKQRTDHVVGHKDAYYPCCNEIVGTSTGCTKAEWHVFKVSEAKRLAAILQFQATPRQLDKGDLPPVCFDCEMGYTTLGLELIRLTAISWPEGKRLLDVLVRPIGEILDLNSRYSGVRPEHFANAIPYGTAPKDKPQSSNAQVMEIVNSPAAARSLLFQYLQPETPLIGHSIENDLNACRIIHPTIVDTALLFPHPRGPPMRFGLRMLAKQYLDRTIQSGGGSKGHDSMEDARATGDLVRVKVRETWNMLKRNGWELKDNTLVPSSSAEMKLKAH
ncbi:hypothetical protein VTO42DRAFT_7743 [Malbranchea cinnamomea]